MCVIAPGFADIFKNNTFQNGILPVALPEEHCRVLAEEAEQGLELEVDLERQEVRRASGEVAFAFEVDPFRRRCLLEGLDDVALTMQRGARIDAFEARRSEMWPWLDGIGYKGRRAPVSARARAMDW